MALVDVRIGPILMRIGPKVTAALGRAVLLSGPRALTTPASSATWLLLPLVFLFAVVTPGKRGNSNSHVRTVHGDNDALHDNVASQPHSIIMQTRTHFGEVMHVHSCTVLEYPEPYSDDTRINQDTFFSRGCDAKVAAVLHQQGSSTCGINLSTCVGSFQLLCAIVIESACALRTPWIDTLIVVSCTHAVVFQKDQPLTCGGLRKQNK